MNSKLPTWTVARFAAALIGGVFLYSACDRDMGHGIYFHNATGQDVVLYEIERDRPEAGRRMAPDERFGTSWIVPSSPSVRSYEGKCET